MVTTLDNTIPELLLGNNEFHDEVFTAAGANTYPAGLILARLAADSKLVIFDAGGTGGAEIPKALLRNELISTGAGDTGIRAVLSGRVREDRIFVWTGGSPVVPTTLVLDELRDFTIIGQEDTELLEFDNS